MGLHQYLGLWGRCLVLHGVGNAGYSTILQINPEEKRTFISCKISLLKYLSLSEFFKTKQNQSWIFIGRTDAEAEAPILATWCKEPTHWKRPWCWERWRAGGKGDDRGWDGWMVSPIQWTWAWAKFMNWWRTGKPGVLCSWGRTELDMTITWIGEGNGNPLQYSCLENPMDGGGWWAAVHGVARSRTRLSDFTFTFHFHALEKEMATHSSFLAWRIPGMWEPSWLSSMGSHRVGHDWSDLAAAAAVLE